MRGVVMYAPGDVRVEDREKPTILEPTDAIIRAEAVCSAVRTCGRTAASRSSKAQHRWGTNTSEWLTKWVQMSAT